MVKRANRTSLVSAKNAQIDLNFTFALMLTVDLVASTQNSCFSFQFSFHLHLFYKSRYSAGEIQSPARGRGGSLLNAQCNSKASRTGSRTRIYRKLEAANACGTIANCCKSRVRLNAQTQLALSVYRANTSIAKSVRTRYKPKAITTVTF